MRSNPGPRPTGGPHSAIETVISVGYAREAKRVLYEQVTGVRGLVVVFLS
jgi:hypothetical protein